MPLRKVQNNDVLDMLKDRKDAQEAGVDWDKVSKSGSYKATRKERKEAGLKRSSGFSGAVDDSEGGYGSSFFRGVIGKPAEAVQQMITHGGNRLQRALGMDPNRGMLGGEGVFSDANVAYADAQPKISALREARARKRRGRTGYDVTETIGSFFTPGPALAKANPIVRGMVQGAVGSALEPVMDTRGGYGKALGKQAGIGSGVGGTLGAVFGLPRNVLGKGAAEIAENVDRGKRLGANLSVAEASTSRPIKMLSDLSANTIVGTHIPKQAEKTLNALDDTLGRTVETISGGPNKGLTPYSTGQTITTGLKKAVEGFKKQSDNMYKQVDASVPAGTMVDTKDVVTALRGPALRFKSNPKLGEELANAKLTRIADLLTVGKRGSKRFKQLDFKEAQELRSELGRLIGQPELLSNVPKGELKNVYGVLTDAMGQSLHAHPKAAIDWEAANRFYKAGRAKIDDVIDPAITGNNPEAVTKHVMNAIRSNADDVRALRNSMSPEQWDEVTGYALRDLGLPSFANRTAENEGFSLTKFLTDYNKLRNNKEGFEAAFKGTKFEQHQQVFDDLAHVSENVKRVGDLANKSRSGYTAANYAIIGSLFSNPLLAAKVAGGTWGASVGLSSPTVAKLIAKAGKLYTKNQGKGRVLNRQLKQLAARIAVASRDTEDQAQGVPQEQPDGR